MKCNKIMERYCSLDAGENVPPGVRLHLLRCSRCSREAQLLDQELLRIKNEFPFQMEHDASDAIMRHVFLSPVRYSRHVSSFKWLFTGIILFAGMMLLPFSQSLSWLNDIYGGRLLFPLHLIMGLLISIYTVIMVGSNLEELKTYVDDKLEKYL
ncbi:MAG: hypothetical protein ACOCX9_07070 [Spirochaetota bacterium]